MLTAGIFAAIGGTVLVSDIVVGSGVNRFWKFVDKYAPNIIENTSNKIEHNHNILQKIKTSSVNGGDI